MFESIEYYREGYEAARKDRQGNAKCPYPEGDARWSAWIEGYGAYGADVADRNRLEW